MCSWCKRELPVSAFAKDRSNKDGLQYHCRECSADRQREWRVAHPDKARAVARQDYARHPERFGAYAEKYNRNEKIARWKRAHFTLVQDYGHNRRAKQHAVGAERVDAIIVAERDDWQCWLCGDAIDKSLRWPNRYYRSIDHVVPLSRGGTHTYDNIRITHWICNVRKNNQIIEPVERIAA